MDGLLYFYESWDEQRKIIVPVKGGGVKRGGPDMSGPLGDLNNQKAADGILLGVSIAHLPGNNFRVSSQCHDPLGVNLDCRINVGRRGKPARDGGLD